MLAGSTRSWLLVLALFSATALAQMPDEAPPLPDRLEQMELDDAQAVPTVDQQFIDDAVRAFGSRENAAALAAESGWHHLQKGDRVLATKRFNQALALDHRCARAFWGLGVMTGQQDKYEVAFKLLERARRHDPKNPKLLTDIGIIRTRHALHKTTPPTERRQSLEEALKVLAEAELRDPNYPPIYTSRAVALMQLGQSKEAQSNLLRAEALERASVDTRLVEHLSKKFVPQPATSAASPAEPAAVKPAVAAPIPQATTVDPMPASDAPASTAPVPPAAAEQPAPAVVPPPAPPPAVAADPTNAATPETQAEPYPLIEFPSHEIFTVVPALGDDIIAPEKLPVAPTRSSAP